MAAEPRNRLFYGTHSSEDPLWFAQDHCPLPPLQSPASGPGSPLPRRFGRRGWANAAAPAGSNAAADGKSALISPGTPKHRLTPAQAPTGNQKRRPDTEDAMQDSCCWQLVASGPRLLLATVQALLSSRPPHVPVPLAPPWGLGAGALGSALSLPTDRASGCTKGLKKIPKASPTLLPRSPRAVLFLPSSLSRFFSLFIRTLR